MLRVIGQAGQYCGMLVALTKKETGSRNILRNYTFKSITSSTRFMAVYTRLCVWYVCEGVCGMCVRVCEDVCECV